MEGIPDKKLLAIAKTIGNNDKLWPLALELNFIYAEFANFRATNHSGGDVTSAGTISMLFSWRDKTRREDQARALFRALQDAGLVEVAEEHLLDMLEGETPTLGNGLENGRENNSDDKKMSGTEFTIIKDDDKEDDEGVASSWSKKKIYKNLLLISLAFLFVFTAFQALSNLQSSINCDAGLGLASLSTIYATLIVSAMLIPSVMIRHLGLKWTLVTSQVCYALYTAANFYPSWATLIPASVVLGLGAAPLWTSKSTYLTTTARAYSKLTGETVPSIVSRFWGIFFFFFQSSQILGNLISSLVFREETSFINSTYTCGSQDCFVETGDTNGTYCDPPEQSLTYTLLSIYLVSGIIAVVIVAVFVDNLGASRKIQDQGTFDLFFATIRLWKEKKTILMIIPLTVYSGLEQAFITGDFTKSYVTCSLGVGWVGYIMICYGLADALCSVGFGRLVKYTGQIPIFSLGCLINVSLVIALFLWEPSYEDLPVFFVIAALWGVADAVWQTQLNALYGLLFPDQQEQAFSNYRLWESVGFTVAFAYSNFLCVWIKLTILVCVLGVGMLGYASAELTVRRNHHRE